MPAPGLHPHQGPAARRASSPTRRARPSSSVSRPTLRGHRHRRGERVQGQASIAPPVQGPAGPHQEHARSPSSRARAGSSVPNAVEVDGDALHGPQRRARPPARTRSRLPGLEIDGERVITSEHALSLDRVPVVGDHPRRRRHRRRVRQRLALLRRRGDHRRGAAAPASPLEDESSSQGCWSGPSASAASASSSVSASRSVETHRHRRHGDLAEDGKTLEAELLLVAVGRGPVSAGLGLRGGRASRWTAASS